MKNLTTEDTESTESDNGGPAFPVVHAIVSQPGHFVTAPPAIHGMSLLDWFAGQALAGILARGFEEDVPHDSSCKIKEAAVFAYGYADAMLAERKREGGIQ